MQNTTKAYEKNEQNCCVCIYIYACSVYVVPLTPDSVNSHLSLAPVHLFISVVVCVFVCPTVHPYLYFQNTKTPALPYTQTYSYGGIHCMYSYRQLIRKSKQYFVGNDNLYSLAISFLVLPKSIIKLISTVV